MAKHARQGSAGGQQRSAGDYGAGKALIVVLGWLASLTIASAQQADTRKADALFRAGRWTETRAAYDELAQGLDRQSPSFLEAIERAALASLKLNDQAGALDRASKLLPPDAGRAEQGRLRPTSRENEEELRQADVARLEVVRELLVQIEAAAPAPDDEFSARLAARRIETDERLVRRLDPPREDGLWGWQSALVDVDWWWVGVPEAEDYINSDERYSRWHWRIGIALGSDGQPIYLESPGEYNASLPRTRKLLFLLDEIQKLDQTPKRNAAAAALLLHARLMRRLYGPQTDEGWGSADFYYRYDKRPSFVADKSAAGVKEIWELADNEARTNIGHRSRVIVLPDSQSPLALLERLEREYPQSESVALAIHERAQYYQSRRQFAKALGEYRREIKQFPNLPLAEKARAQIARIEHADVMLGRTGIYARGLPPKLWFACRNAEQVDFKARRFDLDALIKEPADGNLRSLLYRWSFFDRFLEDDDEKQLQPFKKFIGPEIANWSEPVERSDRVASHATAAPLKEAGAFLVEARVPGSDQSSHGLVIVTGIEVVEIPVPEGMLLWVVDPLDGKPLAKQKLSIAAQDRDRKEPERKTTLVTDERGVAEYRGDDLGQLRYGSVVTASVEGRGTTLCNFDREYYDPGHESELHVHSLTDRPLYRPGSTVNFRIWVRYLRDRAYLPARAGLQLRLTVRGPNYDTIRNLTLETDEFGSVVGSFRIGDEAPLGAYSMNVEAPGQERPIDAGAFRVEEYKAPEFEVAVSPVNTAVRPGEPISAQVEARYYFGLPVAGGEIGYEIYRQEQKPSFVMPAEYDWLYGAGYGAVSSASQHDEDERPIFGRSWYYGSGQQPAPKERIGQGAARLDKDGKAEIRFDPPAAPADQQRDWRYTIEVRVRDEARRTVEASGAIAAPRHEFQAFVEMDRPWYAPGAPMVAEINLRTPNDVPVAAAGKAVLFRLTEVSAGGPPRAEQIQEWELAAQADGSRHLELTAPAAGRYRLEFNAHDSQDRSVTAAVAFWVYDAQTDFSRCPRSALEILADRRTYRPGETARLLIVAKTAGAVVMICQDPAKPRFMKLSGHAEILEIPISEKDVPNLFIAGTLVREGAVHTVVRQLFVPPVQDLLKVELAAGNSSQRPGESGKFKIKVTDAEGRPASGDLALTAFDKAVTYIQPESAIGPRSLVRARLADEWQWTHGLSSTINPRRFETSGAFMCPEFHLTDDYVPQIGMMGGAPPTGGDPGDAGPAAGYFAPGLANFDAQSLIAPKIRSDFSDTALWQPHVKLDELGQAETEIKFPESLTTWRIRGYVVTKETRVGEVAHDVVTSKNLLVRLQRPRFLVERDEVVLLANVHNNLMHEKTVAAELIVPAAVFRTDDASAHADGNLHLVARATVAAGGRHRFEWPLTVIAGGLATVTVKALTDEESDAMRTAIPIRTHGMPETVTLTGGFRNGEQGAKTLAFEIPDDADPRKTRLVVSLAPTPASAAFEAIPYLAGYPYGCVEQTMSRFYPTVLAADTLKRLKIDIARLVERVRAYRHPSFGGPAPDALLDAAELERMTEAGLQRLQRFQHDDGGWGWWEHDQSSAYMTAYVLMGLNVAAESGAKVSEYDYNRGLRYLTSWAEDDRPPADGRRAAGDRHTKMFAIYALALPRPTPFDEQQAEDREAIRRALDKRLSEAFEQRNQLSQYDRLLLALALRDREPKDRPAKVLKEILKAIEVDEARDAAHLPVAARQFWHSWNSEIEINAWLLRVLAAIDRENPLAAKVANWLSLNRKHGRFWRSTQDTALAVTAIAEYLAASGATAVEQTVEVRLDGGPLTNVQIARGDILGVQSELKLPADMPLRPGRHEISVQRSGAAMLQYSLHAEFLRTVALGEARANGIAIERRYFKLASPDVAAAGEPKPAPLSESQAGEARWRRLPLAMDDAILSGDLLEVELTIKADDDYEYVAFEDMKPAGCEPIQLQSGHAVNGDLWPNVELRDDRVVFFAAYLDKGTHVLRYRLRAETPGRFHALPTRGFAMYAPEINAQSDELRLRVNDD